MQQMLKVRKQGSSKCSCVSRQLHLVHLLVVDGVLVHPGSGLIAEHGSSKCLKCVLNVVAAINSQAFLFTVSLCMLGVNPEQVKVGHVRRCEGRAFC